MSHEGNVCGLYKDRVMTTEEWKAKHSGHTAHFTVKPFDGPHDWSWLVCECGASHLTDEKQASTKAPQEK